MKTLFTIALFSLSTLIIAQQTYQKDKKWGISRDGTGNDKDSIIFRAEFDKIEKVGDVIFAGSKNDEWQFLTSNKLVNQQRYESVDVPFFVGGKYAIGSRTGYIDVVSVSDVDFIVRGVQAEKIVSTDNLFNGIEDQIMTQKGEFFGLINAKLKKETLKAKYNRIAQNNSADSDAFPVLAYLDGVNYVCALDGIVIHQFNTAEPVNNFNRSEEANDCFVLRVNGKKGEQVGFFDSKNKWVIPPVYKDCHTLDNTSDAVVVSDVKGEGLYFQGKLLLPCEYLEIVISDKRGYVAKVVNKKGTFYVTPEGKMQTIND
ncbi:MAG: WG repeat-containing protein [Crocinitomicaceae bacterium]|nr:WG repeat-containing protein [Crocinitomicaceae bacterium]